MNNSGFTAVLARSVCKGVSINEDVGVASWPTTDFLVCQILTDVPRRIPAGQAYKFESVQLLQPNAIVGYVKTIAGATTFAQDDSSA